MNNNDNEKIGYLSQCIDICKKEIKKDEELKKELNKKFPCDTEGIMQADARITENEKQIKFAKEKLRKLGIDV